MAPFTELANGFADILTEVVNGTLCSGRRFVVTPLAGGPTELAWVWPAASTPRRRALLPIVSGGEPARLWLNTWFQVWPDRTGDHLAVHKSVFALCIDEATARPALRVEYDRGEGSVPDDIELGVHRGSAAHVQIHGSSEELAYVQAVNSATKLRRLAESHIPVGGRRFRPTLEDFIEFRVAERLVPAPHEGWHVIIGRHRRDWLTLQLMAAVRNDPATPAEPLVQMGYGVTPPDPDRP